MPVVPKPLGSWPEWEIRHLPGTQTAKNSRSTSTQYGVKLVDCIYHTITSCTMQCWFCSTVYNQSSESSTQKLQSTLCFCTLISKMEMIIFFSRSTLNLTTELKVNGVTVWPRYYRAISDLNPTKNLCWIVKRKMRDTRPNHTHALKATIKANLGFHNTSAEPRAGHLHATPHWWNNLFKSIVDQVLSA